MDKQIGNLIEILKKEDQYENTFIIFTSDHGDFLGDHGLLRKGKFLYDSIVKVPLLIKFPGQQENRRISNMVESIDIAPTILQTADVEIPRKLQGKCITDQKNGLVKWREYEFSEAVDLKMIRNKKWKLVYYQSCEYGELYDMEN